jgi:DNA-binding transcriptional regulator YiaG
MQICMQILDSGWYFWNNQEKKEEVRMAKIKAAAATKLAARAGVLRVGKTLSVGAVRGRFGLSRTMFSLLAGFSERAIADWESGKPVSEPGLRRIKELERFRARLSEVVAADVIPSWLETPNDALDGLKPLEVIERGEIDRLWNMIFYLESGVGS